MASAEYLTYDAATASFALPAEHAPALSEEGGAAFLGGVQQELMGLLMTLDTVANAFRNGGGVANSDFDAKTWDGLARLTDTWVKNQLIQTWIPLMPRVQERLGWCSASRCWHRIRASDHSAGAGVPQEPLRWL